MKRIGMIFPGQGSQKVGMGKDIVASYPDAMRVFEKGSDVLGRDIASICFEGPDDVLTQTENAQAGLFLVSAALYNVLSSNGITPVMVAGHSLGELTAYYAAGVYDLKLALHVIRARGNAMASSHPSDDSRMAAIMKLDLDVINEVLRSISSGPVVAANLNCPGQIVISGKRTAVDEASKVLAEKGGRVIPLNVSGAFHSPLMQNASDELAQFLAPHSFNTPSIPVVLNRTATSESDPDALKDNLVKQVISSVRWIESIRYMSEHVDVIVEVGSGRVLSGLVKKILPDFPIVTVNDQASLDAFLAEN